MLVYGEDVLITFCESHPDLRKSADRWLRAVGASVWNTPHDVKAGYASASILANNRVVFNLMTVAQAEVVLGCIQTTSKR